MIKSSLLGLAAASLLAVPAFAHAGGGKGGSASAGSTGTTATGETCECPMMQGQGQMGQMGSNQQMTGQMNQVAGKVTRVMDTNRELFVLDQNTNRVVVLSAGSGSQIMMNGKSIGFNSIPQGAQVRASYDLVGNQMVAKRIDVMQPGSMGSGTQGSGSSMGSGSTSGSSGSQAQPGVGGSSSSDVDSNQFPGSGTGGSGSSSSSLEGQPCSPSGSSSSGSNQ